ncbi:MAG: 50S ribosomal protein L11 methyltransferase [Cyclobacteriaceae bacterium]|nr:50S ribosomal protein L11 methyltransferase [Cyclobacteriaceae bacterium]
MNHIELKISSTPEFLEILMAELSTIGFDTIEETKSGFNAYVLEGEFRQEYLDDVVGKYKNQIITWETRVVEKQNWNAQWEKNYDPIVVEEKCIVKATFHDIEEHYPYEIVINPKMSFGTGHHETTYQILNLLTAIDCTDKHVMDAGCGTGVLAIMANLRGANNVEAFDIDDWCIENSQENFDLNDCNNCHVQLGTIRQLKFDKPFDIIIANINKNVLLDEMESYANHLLSNGSLILSGFYEHDLDDLKIAAQKYGLFYQSHSSKNNWSAAIFLKKE